MSGDARALAEDVAEFCDAVEAACVKLKRQIGRLMGADVKSAWTWDPAKIRWEEAEGFKGLYERSEDVDNPEHKALLKDLVGHKGGLNREGFFYWVFRDGATVGRKKMAKKT